MDFDVVIATRNRHRALELSLPLILSQSRLPRSLIVVDASDDPALTASVLQKSLKGRGAPCDLTLLHAEPGSCRQRNLGLREVAAPVVFFPDDDALWFPGFANAVMRLYERDEEGLIGAVGGTESITPPEGLLPGVRRPAQGPSERMPHFVRTSLASLEKRYFLDPFFLQARVLCRDRRIPEWLGEEQAVAASTITGFRMSFRSDVIKRTGFDETFAGYGLFEDHDACMGVLDTHCIVNAGRAKVFHYPQREKRADEVALGVMEVLNRAYILRKHCPRDFDAQRFLIRYVYSRLLRNLLRSYRRAALRHLTGVWRATRCVPELFNVSKPELPLRYLELRERCLKG